MKLRIGSRGSQLALWQAHHIAALLNALGVETEISIIRTTGDHLQTASLMQAGGKGLFTKEIEEALLAREIDLAVHSLKDLPTELPGGLTLAAIPEREDPSDALIGKTLGELAAGTCVATSSGRRAAQLKFWRPAIEVVPVRGNVDTRLRKLREGHFDAMLLATSGLRRLGLENEIAEVLDCETMCPAAGQGALAIETRADDSAFEICRRLNDDASERAVQCERAVLAALGGGCQLPLGAYARLKDEAIFVIAVVLAADGSRRLATHTEGHTESPEVVGRRAADDLLRQGAAELLSTAR
jgi:hydroxymethylbilane synthase